MSFSQVPRDAWKDLYCTKADLKHAVARSHEIGSHTVSHWMRFSMSDEDFLAELKQSKNLLEEYTGTEVFSFSYPFNAYLFSDLELCRAAGYRVAATVDPGRITKKTSLLEIPRRTVFRQHNSLRSFRSLLVQERW